jgi:hypothetical protein
MNSILTLGPIAAAVLLAACASQQPPPPDLLQARSAVQTAGANPQVLANAPLELKKATDTLDVEALNAKGSLAEVAAPPSRAAGETAITVADAKQNAATIQSARQSVSGRVPMHAADTRRAQAQAANARADRWGSAQASRHSNWPRRRGRKPTLGGASQGGAR